MIAFQFELKNKMSLKLSQLLLHCVPHSCSLFVFSFSQNLFIFMGE